MAREALLDSGRRERAIRRWESNSTAEIGEGWIWDEGRAVVNCGGLHSAMKPKKRDRGRADAVLRQAGQVAGEAKRA